MSEVIESKLRRSAVLGLVTSAKSAAAWIHWPRQDDEIRPDTPEVSTAMSIVNQNEEASACVQGANAAEQQGTGPRPLGGRGKRLVDVVVASTAIVLVSPVLLLIPLLIKLTTGGSVFFVHRRVGFNGRTFNCYKFRTMMPDAEEVLQRYLSTDPQAAQEWIANQKLKHDPRILFFGKMLRKSSLDELPQLFNILRGDMSCVGPRPVVADELRRYGSASSEYLKARPGLTGLWQINGRSTTEYSYRVLLDTQYVQTWSLARDVWIMLWTIPAMMRFDQSS
ncbi:sugar transferase [Mesorhizobium sp. B2-7-1]|uniref:sugar transferase n=1 Tax=Mesorhizobium sp. B2-7-1 TaxID=2589909 RepID=UPI0011280859|nr:exopolysaccharide biosynthesis protein [Mesorhizobium sp. B2-7-1]